MNNILMQLINQFMPFAQQHIGFNEPPKLFLKQDEENANNPLGRTAFYDPAEKSVTLYVTGRHPKDILRSLGHELVHHKQNCDGKFENAGDMGEGYAQKNPHLRKMEIEANSVGSMCLRDFEDGLREQKTIYYEHLQKGENTMSTKDWKNKELRTLLSEAWGFKFNTLQEFDEFNGTGEIQEVSDQEGEADAEKETRGDATDTWEKEGLKETGAKDTGSSADDDSKTHPGEKDYTTKKDDDLKHSGKGRGEKKGDKAYINEDSGEEEGEHYKDNAMHDDDHIKAIEHHLDALKHDRDYDEEHIDEAAKRLGSEDRDIGKDRMHVDRVHEDTELEEEADLEEVGGINPRSAGRRSPHKRTPVPEEDKEKDELKEAIKTLLGKYIKG